MNKWSKDTEQSFTVLIKDWLKNRERSQSDLQKSLKANSSRMNSIIEVIEEEYARGGVIRVAEILCSIEDEWSKSDHLGINLDVSNQSDPFSQLDLLLEELKEERKD